MIVDDPPINNLVENDDTFETQLFSYAILLSYILDSKYYNKYINPLKGKKKGKIRINEKKFFAKYTFNGKDYYGECFDYRLISENFETSSIIDTELAKLFETVTKEKGKTKFFIGLDETVIKAINKKNIEFLKIYNSENVFIDNDKHMQFLDQDGILIVKSIDGADKQLESIFTEEEVKRRLGFFFSYIKREAHQCKAPCRSREIKGKPCEIMTYRSNCHFHR